MVDFDFIILAVFKYIYGDNTIKGTAWRRKENSVTHSLKTPFCQNLKSVST